MGQFSWRTSDTCKDLIEDYIDTDDLIPDTFTKKAYLLIPREFGGGYLKVDGNYDGYGYFFDENGRKHDAYGLIAEWNGIKGEDENDTRYQAIDLYYTPADPGISQYADGNYNTERTMKYPLKITEFPMAYEDAEPCTDDPNQGWGQRPDESEEDDDYNW